MPGLFILLIVCNHKIPLDLVMDVVMPTKTAYLSKRDGQRLTPTEHPLSYSIIRLMMLMQAKGNFAYNSVIIRNSKRVTTFTAHTTVRNSVIFDNHYMGSRFSSRLTGTAD